LTAKFLSPDEVRRLKKRSYDVAQKHVESRYSNLGSGVGTAMFRACMADWGCGATATAARLGSEAASHIEHAWQYREHITGILLQRCENTYIPLFLHNSSLADKLSTCGSIWVDFRKVESELAND